MTTIDPSCEFKITDNERANYTKSTKRLVHATAEAELAWARTQTKVCKDCHTALPLSYYNGNTSGGDPFDKDGYRLRRPECRACSKKANKGKQTAAQAAKRLGMSTKAPPGTQCQLCKTTDAIVFDHDHITDTFRGWLCNSCNRSIGVLGDNVAGILNVLNYLNAHEKRTLMVEPSTGTEVKIVP